VSALAAYRRTGADPPFADLGAAHGVGLEGYYWRFADPAAGRVVVVLCGACAGWALVAVAAHPGGFVRWAIVDPVRLDPRTLGVRAGEALSADARTLRVRLDGAGVDAELQPRLSWPRRAFGALGPAQLVPGLGQYWHPHTLAAGAAGHARLDGETVALDGFTVYAEKNWGSRFAPDWWWGQAQLDGGGVAFAGGRLAVGAPTALVVAHAREVVRLAPPLARMVAATAPGAWRIRADGPRHSALVEAWAQPGAAHVLPVPVVGERRAELRSHQHLAGHLTLTLRRGRRTLLRAETPLAGLERGLPSPARPGAAR
jgi:hypothetical protein